MTTGDVHVGDVGTHYSAKIQDAGVPFDPTRATIAKLLWKPPLAPWFERNATITTDGTDWFLNYRLVLGTDDAFHSKPGLWRWEGFVEFPDGQHYFTNVETYPVQPNLRDPQPWMPRLVGLEQAGASLAATYQGLAVSLWYDRPLQRVGASPLTLSLQSSDRHRIADQVLSFHPGLSHLNVDLPKGKAQVVFWLAPIDLTGMDYVVFTCNDASVRVGWAQLKDLATQYPIPDGLGTFELEILVEPNEIVGVPLAMYASSSL